MLKVVDPGAKPQQAERPGAARVEAPVAAPAACVEQSIEENISKNGTNSQGVASETRLSEQSRDRGSKGSGEKGLREGVRQAMAGSLLARLRAQELPANGRESPRAAAVPQ